MTSSVDSAVTTNDMATNHSSDDNSTKDKNKSNNNGKPLKAGYNNGLKKRGGHSTKQDPNKVDTSGERVVEPRQVVSACCGNTFTCAFARVVFYFMEYCRYGWKQLLQPLAGSRACACGAFVE
jgi:hypothetical protein